MAYSDRTYVGTGLGPGPKWVTVYCVKPSHCNFCGNLNGSYTLALYQSWSRSQSRSHISSVWLDHENLMDKYFLQYQLTLKPILLHLGDYRECLLVVWNTLNYTVLTSTTTTAPMHDVIWDPSTVNEFVSVGTAGRHSTLCESTSLVCFIFSS